MTDAAESLLRMRLEIPALGQRSTIAKGPLELVLERHRAALCLLTHEGNEPRRHFLGLPRDGHLVLEARAPEHRIRVQLRERLTLAPGGRLRGFILIPLPHRLSWLRPNGRSEPLLEVLPRELQTSWLGEGAKGGYVHETHSSFYLEREEVDADIAALVPVLLRNDCDHTVSPADLTVSLRDRDLGELDGKIIASPRRLQFTGQDEVQEKIRPLPRRTA